MVGAVVFVIGICSICGCLCNRLCIHPAREAFWSIASHFKGYFQLQQWCKALAHAVNTYVYVVPRPPLFQSVVFPEGESCFTIAAVTPPSWHALCRPTLSGA